MTSKIGSGFEEVDHTADVCLRIWGKTQEDLFRVALQGLYHSSQVTFDQEIVNGIYKKQIEEIDDESLLVSFLSECNHLMQYENSYLIPISIRISQGQLIFTGQVFRVLTFQREIKAVTFHNLDIIKNENGYSAYIVFDV